ncbi:MAG: AIPR family protein [Erysipelotrichales bacterium]|nr:AIPR family protein [Erysipelotrichales bacterium]
MNQTYAEFEKEFLDDIRINAQIDGTTPDDYFLNDVLNRLSSMGEIIDPQVRPMQKKCRNGKIMSFDAYSFDETDKSIVLVSNDFVDDVDAVLTKTEIEQHKQRMLNFMQEAYDCKLQQFFDFTDELLVVGQEIGKRLKIDYVNLEQDSSLDKIKLIIITNKKLSERIKTLPSESFLGKKLEINIWSLFRFYELYESGREREPILIETEKFGVKGIPCIKAEMSGNLDYDAYLAIVPGSFLHSIYYEHGSRLLEGNVRAFLSNRGKINKGIRDTIRKEPTKFFSYNNGIACTASKVVLSEDGHDIISMEDLQIINGGQTTASLTSAVLKDKLLLDNIFVPMKLTVVKNDDYDTMIQNISKYANSQNKVKDSDLFSNHPFHRTFEALAKKIQAPAHGDSINNTLWYYERSRGKYEQEQFKFTKKSEKDNFLKKFPKSQVIKKEELSKYFTCAELLRPDLVSKGSEKCMSFFAEYIDGLYQKKPETFNDQFFKNCICYTILFRTVDRIVNKAEWYNIGGYKLNIVPYTISKLISSIPSEYCLDFDRIWRKQELYPSLNYEIERLARVTNEFIQKSNGVIVTEYCKKEDTWKKFIDYKYQLSNEFLLDLIKKELIEERARAEERDNKMSASINIETEIINLGGPYWRNIIQEGLKRKLLSPDEISLLNIAASIDTSRPRIASPKQAKLIWKIREKLENAGVLV